MKLQQSTTRSNQIGHLLTCSDKPHRNLTWKKMTNRIRDHSKNMCAKKEKTAKVEKKCSPTVVRLSSCCSPAVALLLNWLIKKCKPAEQTAKRKCNPTEQTATTSLQKNRELSCAGLRNWKSKQRTQIVSGNLKH